MKRLPVRFIRTGGALFGAPLTAPWSGQGQARAASAGRGHTQGWAQRPGLCRAHAPMCRRPLCPFLRCMKFLLMQRLTSPVCRFSGFTGGEMNFHKCGWNCRVFCGNNSTLWISPPFGRLWSDVNFHIVWNVVTHDGKFNSGGFGHVSFGVVVPLSATAGDISPPSFRPVGAPLRGITGRRPRSGRLGQNRK